MTERELARKKAAARKARMERERKKRNRRVVMTVVLMLAVCVASVGGTIAWLTDKTEAVTNTFSPTDIEIKLEETRSSDGTDNSTPVTNWTAQLIPGKEYNKNPNVSVEDSTSVDVWLFVEVDEGAKSYLSYDLTLDDNDSGWTNGDGSSIPANVWYREVKTDATTKKWSLLKDDKVTVLTTLTKEGMPSDNVTMDFTAYAIQKHGFDTASAAWTEVSKLNTTSGSDTTNP